MEFHYPLDLDSDFIHNMGRTRGRTILRAERESMHHGEVSKFMVFNEQEATNGK
jgi:hypothetical protein